jgi:hypothetical protein
MINYPAMTGWIAALLLFAGPALADDKEPSAIVQIGAAGEWSLQDSGSGFGPSVAVETTVIRNWLEIEAGVTPLFGGGQTQWSTDLLFKKPWTLSKTAGVRSRGCASVAAYDRRRQDHRFPWRRSGG